jgi:hypothetical protein
MKKTALYIMVIGTTLAIVSNAQTVNDTARKKKYEYIYGIGKSPTLDGGYEIVYRELIDSVEITETDTLNIK